MVAFNEYFTHRECKRAMSVITCNTSFDMGSTSAKGKSKGVLKGQ
jgi:hypothetical protein